MSDLIEKVARGIAAAQYFVDSYTPGTLAHVDALNAVEEHWPDYYSEARAAIAAVAEWLAQSEDRECNPLQAFAAALRAAAGDGR